MLRQVDLPFAAGAAGDTLAHMAPQARYYQRDCAAAIKAGRDRGVLRQLFVMPTGSGKSHVFSMLPTVLEARRTLVLTHQFELIDQAANHMHRANPLLEVGIEQAENYADDKADIVVASVPTLGPKASERLSRWPKNHFDLVIADEADMSLAPTWRRTLEHFNCGNGTLLCGCTATPFRGDGQPLANVYDEVVFERSLRDTPQFGPSMITDGWLVPIKPLRIKTDADITNVTSRLGDFAEAELAHVANTDYRNSLICSAIRGEVSEWAMDIVQAVDCVTMTPLRCQLLRAAKCKGE